MERKAVSGFLVCRGLLGSKEGRVSVEILAPWVNLERRASSENLDYRGTRGIGGTWVLRGSTGPRERKGIVVFRVFQER